MANQHSRGRFHPSRISGEQKFLRKNDFDKLNARRKRANLEPLNIKGGDWSVAKKQDKK